MAGDRDSNASETSSRPPFRLLISAWTVIFLSYFSVGYQNAVLNAATDVFLDFINSSYVKHGYSASLSVSSLYALYSVVVSLWQIGCIFGSLFACKLEEKVGRKNALLTVASSLQIVGSFLMVLAPIFESFELLALGRFIAGLSSGIVCPTLRVFLCEISPNAYRGYLNGPGGFVLSAAAMIALGFAQPSIFGSLERAPFLLGFCIIPSIAQLLISPCIPASPKFLYIERGESPEAVKAIFFYHGPEANVAKLFREYELEKRLAETQLSFRRALMTKAVRVPVILSVVISLAHSSIGVDILQAYSMEIFSKLGMNLEASKLFSFLFNIPGLIGGILAIFVADRWGRRPLLLCTLGISVMYNILFVVLSLASRSYGFHWSIGYSAVALTGLQEFFYSLGPGAVAEALFAEISPQNVRAVIGSLSEFTFWVSNSIYVFAFPPLLMIIGPYSYLLYTIPLILCVLYMAYGLPETAGRSVVEIVEDLSAENEGNGNGAGGNFPIAYVDSAADFLPFISNSISTNSVSGLISRSMSPDRLML